MASAGLFAAEEPLFERDIRPLLQKHCTECHGENKQKGGLRLDSKVHAFRGAQDGVVIVPGSAEKSSLYARVSSHDPDTRMPPKGAGLGEKEVGAIRAWLEAGASWPENEADRLASVDKRLAHWSVQPVRRDFPVQASVDYYVRGALERRGLSPGPPADRRTLARRLSFDLHGLPPAPERVERFVADPSPRAYEDLVEEMLASPRYGERWARHWLDIAHYADTHGFERDQIRANAWRYRDYVVGAFNLDTPYDTFLRDQIAGDVFGSGNPQAAVATGFLAAGPWDFVGQVETKSPVLRRAARAGDLDDMVTQVITSTMGLTINCARCHDHKLDPITQREYYASWAVFAGVKRGERAVDVEEAKRVDGERRRLGREVAAVRGEIGRLTGEALDVADLLGGGNGRGTGGKGQGIHPGNGRFVSEKLGFHREIPANRMVRVEWKAGHPEAERFVRGVFVPDGRGRVNLAPDLALEGLPATSAQAWDALRNGALNAQKSTVLDGVDYAAGAHALLGLHANSGVVLDLEKIRAAHGLTGLQFSAVVGFGAGEGAVDTLGDFSVYVDARLAFQKLRMRKSETVRVEVSVPPTAQTLTLVATDGGDGIGSDLLFLGDPRLAPDGGGGSTTEADRTRLTELRDKLAALQKEQAALGEPEKVYAVVGETQVPVVRVQRRGNPEEEGAEVTPGGFAWAAHAPAVFGDNTTLEGERRRALAEWIVHPENPLTRRVLVNRVWHHLFGQGIVTTPSDFGTGGDRPSHPELLDWLAQELMRSGWSIKHVQRLILKSAAYRQASAVENAGAAAVDAQNRLVWRQNARRLDAESVHDAVLFVSGKLNLDAGGPGFRDFKYTEAYAPIYDYITADEPALWRRSIYRFIVRTTPHQFLTTLDCPDPANLTPARTRTTTALQALTLSNNAFMLRQAGYLAERLAGKAPGGDPAAQGAVEEKVRGAFRLCFQREPTGGELHAAAGLARSQGLGALCRMLMNANEFVYID